MCASCKVVAMALAAKPTAKTETPAWVSPRTRMFQAVVRSVGLSHSFFALPFSPVISPPCTDLHQSLFCGHLLGAVLWGPAQIVLLSVRKSPGEWEVMPLLSVSKWKLSRVGSLLQRHTASKEQSQARVQACLTPWERLSSF